jgi:hypothetical protein
VASVRLESRVFIQTMVKFPGANRTQNCTIHARTEVPAMVGMTAVDNCRPPTSVFPSGPLRKPLSVAKVIMGKGYHYQHLCEQNSWKKNNKKKRINSKEIRMGYIHGIYWRSSRLITPELFLGSRHCKFCLHLLTVQSTP